MPHIAYCDEHKHYTKGCEACRERYNARARAVYNKSERALKQSTEWRKAHPEKVKLSSHNSFLKHREAYKARRIERVYGLSKEEYLALLKKQNNSCAICKNLFKAYGEPQVDHNHKTGKVRGLLCNKCNVLLGLASDNPAFLQAALDYIMTT